MTDFSSLSPAARAIMDAYHFAPIDDELTAAAVLRAVAEHCVPDDSEGHWVYISHVLAIASELDGTNDTRSPLTTADD